MNHPINLVNYPINIWGFPKIGVPLVIIHFEGWDFPVHKKHPASLGDPHDYGKPYL